MTDAAVNLVICLVGIVCSLIGLVLMLWALLVPFYDQRFPFAIFIQGLTFHLVSKILLFIVRWRRNGSTETPPHVF